MGAWAELHEGLPRNEEAARATIDRDGWLHSGDVAVVDDDGYSTIVDRVKALIKYIDAAVVPIPDEEAGELPKAYVVRRGAPR